MRRLNHHQGENRLLYSAVSLLYYYEAENKPLSRVMKYQ